MFRFVVFFSAWMRLSVTASIFVEFETKESAEKAVEKSDELTWEGESISVRFCFGVLFIVR